LRLECVKKFRRSSATRGIADKPRSRKPNTIATLHADQHARMATHPEETDLAVVEVEVVTTVGIAVVEIVVIGEVVIVVIDEVSNVVIAEVVTVVIVGATIVVIVGVTIEVIASVSTATRTRKLTWRVIAAESVNLSLTMERRSKSPRDRISHVK